MKTNWLAAHIGILCVASSIFAITGKGAMVVSWYTNPQEIGYSPNSSKLIISSVTDNRVTTQDTILKNGVFYYPTLSFDGSRVAFYKQGAGLSVIDITGQNLRTLVQTADWPGSDKAQYIAWPGADGGKWIYYHRSCTGCSLGGSGEIWKVNVDDPTQNTKVVDYTACDNSGLFLKFSLSTDAKYACIHTNNQGGSCITSGNNAIIPHTFPPQGSPDSPNSSATKPSCPLGCTYAGACNSALSTSAAVLWHFDGGHTTIYPWKWDHVANSTVRMQVGTGAIGSLDEYRDIDNWLLDGPGMGGGLVYPRGTANSDQLIGVLSIWSYQAGYIWDGNNYVVANWKDKEAVMLSNNPDLKPASGGPVANGTPYPFCEPGDFWLQPPMGKSGCYEDVDGNWVPLEGAVSAVEMRAQSMKLPLSTDLVTVYDLKGARIGAWHAQSAHRVAHGGAGVFVIQQKGRTAHMATLDHHLSGK